MNLFRYDTLLLACLASGLATSCSVTPPSDINGKYADVLEQRHHHYRLKPGDSVSIQLYNVESGSEFDQPTNLILPDGRTDLFHMQNVQITGMTIDEFEARLKESFADEFRNAVPETKIQVSPAGEHIYVHGEFQRPPGQLAFIEKMTLRDAIAAAGGLRVTADTDWALLRRPYRDPRHPDLFRIDLNDLSEALFLLPGDEILLERTFLASVGLYLREYIFQIFSPAMQLGSFAATTL